MKKLIATGSKKNIERIRRQLDNLTVEGNIPGVIRGRMKGSEAIALGVRLLDESKPVEALSLAELMLTKIDNLVDVYLIRARALLELEALGELMPLISFLLAEAPGNIGVLTVSSRFYYLSGDLDWALKLLKKANELEPNSISTLLSIELCYRYSNHIDKAKKVLDRCLKITQSKQGVDGASFKQFTATLLRLAQYSELSQTRMESLNKIFMKATKIGDVQLQVRCAYAIAKQYEMRKEKTREIEFLKLANELESELLGVKDRLRELRQRFASDFERQQAWFDSYPPSWLPTLSSEHKPIFILGLPRSGTTLVEQILGTHSQVGQTGESKAFLFSLRKESQKETIGWQEADYPESVTRLSTEQLGSVIRSYEIHQSVLTNNSMYVDKELSNTRYVGLMASLFQGARFIHVDRAPLDIFLSCYRNSIPGVPETTNLEAIAEYYIYVKRLVGHWKKVFKDRVMIVNYQDLVSSPEGIIKSLVDFLEIDYEKSMLEFYQRKNIVRSLSVDQVRNQIYSSSVEKWRDYEEVMAPARRTLEGYNLDISGVPYL